MLFVCIPAYNEEKNIGSLLERIRSSLSGHEPDYRVIVYDDGSDDETAQVVRRFMESMPIDLMEGGLNKGLACGFENLIKRALSLSERDDDAVVMLDGDDTHDPSQIQSLIDKLDQGFDVAIASRFRRGSKVVGVPTHRNLLSLGAAFLMKTVFPIRGVLDYTCGYRAYRIEILRRVVDRYGDKLFESEEFACTVELLIKLRTLGVRATEVPMALRYDRKGGESKMRTGRNIVSTLKTILRLKLAKP